MLSLLTVLLALLQMPLQLLVSSASSTKLKIYQLPLILSLARIVLLLLGWHLLSLLLILVFPFLVIVPGHLPFHFPHGLRLKL